jgi:hypothetical protein
MTKVRTLSTALDERVASPVRGTVVCAVVAILFTVCMGARGMESISLPPFWQVKLDPGDSGVREQWFSRDAGDGESEGWQEISTHKWAGWDKQGMPEHVGFAWYRTREELPESSGKGFVYLYFSAVDEEAWVWVNGEDAGEHTSSSQGLKPGDMWQKPFFLDITRLVRPGQTNQFSVRVGNSRAMGGIWQPVHLFTSDTPLTLEKMKERADVLNQDILGAAEGIVRYEVWAGYPYDPVFPDTVLEGGASEEPAADADVLPGSFGRNRAGTIRVEGACGERVPIAIHVRNLSEVPLPCRIDFQNVRHQERPGFVLTGDRVDVHVVDFVTTRTSALVPDPLPRAAGGSRTHVPPGQTGSFFISIDTRALPAGLWSGHVRLTPLRSGPALDIPFELNVAAAVLPERAPIWVTLWSYVPRWISARYGGRGGDERYVELMQQTGVNTVLTRSYGMPWPERDDQREVVGIKTLDFTQMLVRRKFDGDKDFLVIGVLPESQKGEWGREFLDEKWSRNFIKYVRFLSAHVRENLGIPYSRWALYLEDEQVAEHFVSLAKLTREADPKIRIWANPQGMEDLEVLRKAEPYIDIFVPARRVIGRYPESDRLMHENGKDWWMYGNAGNQPPDKTAVPRNDPHAAHRNLRMDGWMAWKHDLKGMGYWIYVGKWGGRYCGLPKNKVGDCSMVYFGHGGPITTRRLEAYREGVEDHKLLWIIDQAAGADGQDPDLARTARAHIGTAVEEVLAAPRTGEKLQRWRHTLLEDAGKLCAAAPLDVKVVETTTTQRSATLTLAASKPVRAWVWHRGEGNRPTIENRNWRLVGSSLEADTSLSLNVGDLVPGQRSEFTLVVAGPEGQQRLLVQEARTQDW